MHEAQELANKGEIVVVGWHSLSMDESGHVAVVVPGEEVESDKWGCNVPLTMDTGENHRWSSDMLSRGFGQDKKEGIKFFRYRGSIKKQ